MKHDHRLNRTRHNEILPYVDFISKRRMAGKWKMAKNMFEKVSNDHDVLTHLYTKQPSLLSRHYAD